LATKSYKLRLDLRDGEPLVDSGRFSSRADETRSVQQWLDETREAFNAGVDYLTGWLLRIHRGAGVCREKKDGVWREWSEITTLDELKRARSRYKEDPGSFALLENRDLLDAFMSKGRSEAEAIELAECCRRIAKELCPPGEDGSGAQMPRDDLDLLTLDTSTAKGIRDRGQDKSGNPKQKSGRRPRWKLKEAIAATVSSAHGWNNFETTVAATPQFQSAASDGKSLLAQLRQKHDGTAWADVQARLSEYASTWQEDRTKAEKRVADSAARGSIAAYRRMVERKCLPLPGLQRPSTQLRLASASAEWNYAMWNMAGQRVRSHLGWVRRRANERMLWELRTALFERGGWIRTNRNGKAVKNDELTPDDIRFEAPPECDVGDFEQRRAYAGRQWVKTLRRYESEEMPKHLEGVAFGAAGQPRIRRRTAKGWAKVREKWIDLIKKASGAGKLAPTASDLIEAVHQLRARKSRDYGDQRLFEWLAAPERRWLWDGSNNADDTDCGHEARDCVTAYFTHNEHLADKPDSITFTRSDPVKHPVWPFFGENSAVEYWLAQQQAPNGKGRLVLVLKQLLSRQPDRSYTAVDRVMIALRGYDDFEKSFAVPNGTAEVSTKQTLVFRDDLLGEKTRQGTLSGMKLTWERDELEAANRTRAPVRTPARIYANFSCDAGEAALPAWLTKHVGSDVKLKKARDGMTRSFFLKKTIGKDGATEDGAARLPPEQRKWPQEAVDNGFTIRGTDLGYRTSSAGAWWRLSFTKPAGKISWTIGKCGNQDVYGVLERSATVSLPGDGEPLPSFEQALRDRLYSLRTRLNLNNALLRIARLLALQEITQRIRVGDKTRTRSDRTTKRIGAHWKTETKTLTKDEIKDNCRKAAEQLIRWGSTDAMSESLTAIDHDGPLWGWLALRDKNLKRLGGLLPTTFVPTEKEAKEQKLDRDTVKAAREKEDDAFASCAYELRIPLAKALCDGHDPEKHIRAKSGLWAEFDAALMRGLSYSDRGNGNGNRVIFDDGLLRVLRQPPVTKHNDRKDDANNLPHGRTHRGGLSMARLNFLDDVKNFVRRWSCRPRWPGDVRRVPEDAKFDRCDTEHLDHLREHRAKLIAHTDVAQTLGFDQDLRRGLWRYRDPSGALLWHRPERGHWYREHDGRLVQCQPPRAVSEGDALHPHPAYDPAHVLVYEDLTRYRMSSDRPKNENAGLARWSHRRILAFAQHIGGLFGVPVATVDARFSSRYCSQCGAPGSRAVRFDPAWLNQSWMQRVIQSNDIRDAAMKSVATDVRSRIDHDPHAFDREEDRAWVLRDGGTHFVCAKSGCPIHSQPINADENAAANIGLRFLRGVDGIRVTINPNGKVARSVGYVPPGMVLTQAGDANTSQGEPYWSGDAAGASTGSSRRGGGTRNEPSPETDIEDDAESGGVRVLFRDPSGGFRCRDHWFEGKVYWAAVARSCAAGIKAVNASRFGSDEGD